MTLSRRNFLADASMLGLMSALLPELAAAQSELSQMAAEDLPHDSYGFWNGFFDSVNPSSSNYGNKAATRGPEDQLPDPAAQTQYLHYDNGNRRLRYASDIRKEELLDHDGDVSVNIALAQFRPSNGELSQHPAQFRVDTTQIKPIMGIVAPLAWSAIASLNPNKAGSVSMDQLGFKSPQAMQGTNRILLTGGTGKLAVNISKAPTASFFFKALNIMIQGAKIGTPILGLPAISVPALSSFTQMLSYWEDRTRFVMAGNLTTAVATQQAMDDPDREPSYLGLTSGDYLMVPQRHVDELSKALPSLDLTQGYLVAKDADPNLPLAQRAQSALPGITYASMRVSVQPAQSSAGRPTSSSGESASCPTITKKSSTTTTTKSTTK
ncbi:MAG: hypothetical protein P4K93_05555 [Terracidiphilus sp.]|nr:hypothetical protein [Terracidiphilus sp.]MDR3797594.1 hypothetical protein [Terracidiphilus sp.]